MLKINLFILFLSLASYVAAFSCDPEKVEYFRHPYTCTKFVVCFHGNAVERSCANGLEFNELESKCMPAAVSRCDEKKLCPLIDDETNPDFVPNKNDCSKYYVCFNGKPLERNCAEGLWWDVLNNWCTVKDEVKCDVQTIINPDNPKAVLSRMDSDDPIEATTKKSVPKEKVAIKSNKNEEIETTEDPMAMTKLTARLMPISTKPPVTSGCHTQKDILDSEDGSYIKSLCVIAQGLSYENSENHCKKINMRLFIVDSEDSQTVALDVVNQWAGGHVWINGRKDENNCEWTVDGHQKEPVFKGLKWVKTSAVNGRTSGECLIYSGQYGTYKAMGKPCSLGSWFMCEYNRPAEVNNKVCWAKDALVDENGLYLKTSCIISVSNTYDQAHQTCNKNGMQLFAINNATVQAAFLKKTIKSLKPHPGGYVWINGRKSDENCQWHTYSPGRALLYDGIKYIKTDSFDGKTAAGDCLRSSGQHGYPYKAMRAACSSASWIICEYY